MMIIETERLLLREMTEDGFSALYKVLADSNIMEHYPYTFDENRVAAPNCKFAIRKLATL